MAKARKGSAGPGLRLAAVNGAAVMAGAAASAARATPLSAARVQAGPEQPPVVGELTDGISALECAAMGNAMLAHLRMMIAADLAVVEAEYRARQEMAEHLVKRLRRTIVDARLPRVPGEVLVAEAGNQFSYVYSGTPWKLTANSARQRGLPEGLVGRMVCYAWGKPLLEEDPPPPATHVPLAASRHDADEDDIPF